MLTIDARGLPCPLPIVRLAAAARSHPPGSSLQLVATDPAVEPDLAAWCAATGHTQVSGAWQGTEYYAEVRTILHG